MSAFFKDWFKFGFLFYLNLFCLLDGNAYALEAQLVRFLLDVFGNS